jgi:hypothetical protein
MYMVPVSLYSQDFRRLYPARFTSVEDPRIELDSSLIFAILDDCLQRRERIPVIIAQLLQSILCKSSMEICAVHFLVLSLNLGQVL